MPDLASNNYKTPEEPLALRVIKARQSDYWNKIALYNNRVHQLEQQEHLEKKRRDQRDMRDTLDQ